MSKILVDTNIFIYSLDKKSKYYEQSVELLSSKTHRLFTTAKNITEFAAVGTKLKIDFGIINKMFEEILSNVKILFPTSESIIRLFQALFREYKPVGNRIFDLEIVSVMLTNSISYIATFIKRILRIITKSICFNSDYFLS